MQKLIFLCSLIFLGTVVHTYATDLIVGGDSDIHGCKASAGYTWDAVMQTCVRPWEVKKITPKQLIQSGSWNYATLDGVAISGTLQFNKDNTYSAKICNNISGKYSVLVGRFLTLRSGISTMMYCDGGGLMQAEQAMIFSRAILTVTADTLTIKTPKNTFVLKR